KVMVILVVFYERTTYAHLIPSFHFYLKLITVPSCFATRGDIVHCNLTYHRQLVSRWPVILSLLFRSMSKVIVTGPCITASRSAETSAAIRCGRCLVATARAASQSLFVVCHCL